MSQKIYTSRFSYFVRLNMLLIFSLLCVYVTAQNPAGRRPIRKTQDTALYYQKIRLQDSLLRDSLARHPKRISPNAIKSIVSYSAKDSTVNDLEKRYTYLFGDAVVKMKTWNSVRII